MSRLRLPRRIAVSISACAAGLIWATAAAAQPSDERQTVARTVIGAPGAERCSIAAATGDSSEDAVAQCDRALRSERLNRANQVATLINRGAIRLRRNEGELALTDFDQVVGLEPRHAEAHLNRGAALVMIGRPGPAVAAITEALTLGVREPHKAYYNRAAAREALGDLPGALEDYSTALAIEPDWGPANAELARFARTRREQLASRLAQPEGN
jgi:tetratricopeptide (TPR) repeat protein